ncbi:hypothetical protein PAXRUDRAFT_127331, partial [Paxillus rubicundulus Ve08.2h10]
YRFLDCFGRPLFFTSCCIESHRIHCWSGEYFNTHPFHQVEQWTGTHFQESSLRLICLLI